MALSAQDRVEIMQLVARYNQAADARDAEAWADTFTEDGVFIKDARPEVKGRTALAKNVRDLPPTNSRHWTLNLVIDGDEDRASMQADFALLCENRIDYTGRYVNSLRKVDGRWKFERRELTTNAAITSDNFSDPGAGDITTAR
jgi:uncharacterized protein (TIGR02246 family)